LLFLFLLCLLYRSIYSPSKQVLFLDEKRYSSFFFLEHTGVTISRAHVETSNHVNSFPTSSTFRRALRTNSSRYSARNALMDVFTAWEAHHICTLSRLSKVLRTLMTCVPKSETPSIPACRLMLSFLSRNHQIWHAISLLKYQHHASCSGAFKTTLGCPYSGCHGCWRSGSTSQESTPGYNASPTNSRDRALLLTLRRDISMISS